MKSSDRPRAFRDLRSQTLNSRRGDANDPEGRSTLDIVPRCNFADAQSSPREPL